jgi:Flp pilus assembly protein TadD
MSAKSGPRRRPEARHAARRAGRWQRWWPGLTVIGLAVAAYLNALPNGFVSDAKGLIVDNPELLKSDEWLAWFSRHYFWGSYIRGSQLYRPLSILSYVATLRVFGVSAVAFIVGNIVLHAAVSGLVFVLGRRLIGAPAAWLGALLFAVHPLHTEAVAWIGGRPDLLSAVLALSASICFLRATDAGAARPAWPAILTIALYFGAMLSKEHAVTLLIWFVAVWLVDRQRRSTRWTMATLAGGLVVLAVFLMMRVSSLPPARGGYAFSDAALMGRWQVWRWLAGPAVAGKYATLFVWPSTLTFEYRSVVVGWYEARRVPAPEVAVGCLVVAIFVAAFVWALRRDRGLALVLAFTAATYALLSGVPFTPQLHIAERFTYLPSAGACLAVGWLFVWVGRKLTGQTASDDPRQAPESPVPRWIFAGTAGRVLGAVFAVVVVLLAARGAVRNTDWRSGDTIAAAALVSSPDSPLALRTLGHEEYRRGNFARARALMERSLKLDPWRADAYVVLAEIHLKDGDTDALVNVATRAEARLPKRRELVLLGGMLWQAGRREDAERLLRRVETVHPEFVQARLALGGLLLETGRPEGAFDRFRAASVLEPQNGLAWFGMAQAATALGRADEARGYVDRAKSTGLTLPQTRPPGPTPR